MEKLTLESVRELIKKYDQDVPLKDIDQDMIDRMNEQIRGQGSMEKARAIWNVMADEDLWSGADTESDSGAEDEFIDFVLEQEAA